MPRAKGLPRSEAQVAAAERNNAIRSLRLMMSHTKFIQPYITPASLERINSFLKLLETQVRNSKKEAPTTQTTQPT